MNKALQGVREGFVGLNKAGRGEQPEKQVMCLKTREEDRVAEQ